MNPPVFIVITPEWATAMYDLGIWDAWKERVIVKEPYEPDANLRRRRLGFKRFPLP